MLTQILNLPNYTFKFKTINNKAKIFDKIRRKFIALTPEEWVRQNFVCYLISEKGYPPSLISIETGLKYNSQLKRTDVVVYSDEGKPILLIECKAPGVSISNETFEQITRYNSSLKVKTILVTNGLKHYCCEIDYQTNTFKFIDNIPEYKSLNQ